MYRPPLLVTPLPPVGIESWRAFGIVNLILSQGSRASFTSVLLKLEL